MKSVGKNTGSYCIEGAFTITIFTICMMVLLSLFSIIKVEGEVQDALNESALELSQLSYSTGMEHPISAPVLVNKNFHKDNLSAWMNEQGIRAFHPVLKTDQDTLKLQVTYLVKVNTYGLFQKILPICQTAELDAMLPENLRSLYGGFGNSGADSIWKKPPFQRGRYFIGNLRSGQASQAVKPGQGIDLYNPVTGAMTEQISLNLFDPYYSVLSGDDKLPNSYSPKKESIERELINYGRDFTKDVRQLKGSIEMKNGTHVPAKTGPKHMILTVPLEAKENPQMEQILQQISGELKSKYGISVEVQYLEEALV